MDIEYTKTDLKVKIQYEDDPKYGLHEKINEETGEKHSTIWNAETNTRVSKDVDECGNIIKEHATDQNYPKGDPRRH